jgi:hypothetical protein
MFCLVCKYPKFVSKRVDAINKVNAVKGRCRKLP